MSGLTNQKVDDKGRWIIPSDLREPLGVRFWLTLDADNNMVVIPNTRWEKLRTSWEGQLEEQMLNDSFLNAVERTLTYASEVNASTNGWRVPIPELIRVRAELNKEIVTVGSLDRVVVWNRDKFLKVQEERYDHPETLRMQRRILRGAALPTPKPTDVDDNGNAETSHSGISGSDA